MDQQFFLVLPNFGMILGNAAIVKAQGVFRAASNAKGEAADRDASDGRIFDELSDELGYDVRERIEEESKVLEDMLDGSVRAIRKLERETEEQIDERTVDVWIGRLRKAIKAAGGGNPLRTVRSIGYVFDL